MKLEILIDKLFKKHDIELNKSKQDDLMHNNLKVKYSKDILNKYGQLFNVKSPPKKTMLMKKGNCYSNAISKMNTLGYSYVEGVIRDRNTRFVISHAWNVNEMGVHIDFTINDPENYEYTGIIIPESLLYEIGFKNGGTWYCTLPYLKCI